MTWCQKSWAQVLHLSSASYVTLDVAVVQLLSRVWLFATLWTAARQASLSFPISWNLFKLISIESMRPSNHFMSSPSPPAHNLSQHQGLFQWIGSLHQVAKVLELHIQYQSFQWVFSVDFLQDLIWFDLLGVQGTLVTYTYMCVCVCVCVCVCICCA